MPTRVLEGRPVYPASIYGGSSTPSPVGSSSPAAFPVPSRAVEHPQALSTTVEVGFPPVVPLNDSILATGFPPESPPDPAEAPA